MPPVLRYPNHVCHACALRAVASDGRPVRFTNVSISGGIAGMHSDTCEPYDSTRCWIDGVECEAREAKFGGIVIRPVL